MNGNNTDINPLLDCCQKKEEKEENKGKEGKDGKDEKSNFINLLNNFLQEHGKSCILETVIFFHTFQKSIEKGTYQKFNIQWI